MAWEELRDVRREAAALKRAEEAQPPQACPNDGEPLEEHRGIWHCPWGDYEWPRDGRR